VVVRNVIIKTHAKNANIRGKLRRFIENKGEVSDELFEALNKIERFTTNAAINSKTQTKINTYLF